MLRRASFSRHTTPILVASTLLTASGCRQLGNRTQQNGPTPIGPSAPAFTPYESPGSGLQEIPPMPPSAASTYDPSAPKAMGPGGWSRPKSLSAQPVSRSTTSRPIKLIAGEETGDDHGEVPLILPPAELDEEAGLVPPPHDAEEELLPIPARQATVKIVELDVAEFLAELEHTPAPIKAQTHLEPLPVPASSPVISAPILTASSSLTPWPPNGVDHGIVITPGPTGVGNRLETFPNSSPSWNSSRIVSPNQPPAWSSMNFWAGQNSDWGGRQFR